MPGLGTALQTTLATPALAHAAAWLTGVGWVLLTASFAVSVQVWGWAMGPVAWFGLISLAGLGVAFLLPYSTR